MKQNRVYLIRTLTFIFVAFVFFSSQIKASSADVPTSNDDNKDGFDFDGLQQSFRSYDFKVGVAPGAEWCLFQPVVDGLMVLFKVLRGADKRLNVIIRRQDGKVVQSLNWMDNGDTRHYADIPGTFSVCLDNRMSREGKLVYIFLQIFSRQKITADHDELTKFNISATVFSEKIANISRMVTNDIVHYQTLARQGSVSDWYQVTRNRHSVQWWSTLISCFQVIIGIFQVYFVRRLFSSRDVKNISKPRA